MTSFSAIQSTDLQNNEDKFPKIFPKMLAKLIPAYFQEEETEAIRLILSSLSEAKSTKELASIVSCTTRTLKDKYLGKLLQSRVVAMTIPEKPTSEKQKYRLAIEDEN